MEERIEAIEDKKSIWSQFLLRGSFHSERKQRVCVSIHPVSSFLFEAGAFDEPPPVPATSFYLLRVPHCGES